MGEVREVVNELQVDHVEGSATAVTAASITTVSQKTLIRSLDRLGKARWRFDLVKDVAACDAVLGAIIA